jgi:hypothetical protein
MSSAESDAFFDAIGRSFRRAVQDAREHSIRMGAPFYVWQDGKVVDLNAVEHGAAESAAPYAAESDE